MAESHGTREACAASGDCDANPWVAQSLEYWQCGDLAMAESHGTREFIGGGEL